MNLIWILLLQKASDFNLESDGGDWSPGSSPVFDSGQVFYLIIVFIIIIFFAYYATKFLAGGKMTSGKNLNIKRIESFVIGQHSNVQLIKVGEKFFLIAVTKEQINLLSEIDKEDIEEPTEVLNIKMPFEKYLNKMSSKKNDQ